MLAPNRPGTLPTLAASLLLAAVPAAGAGDKTRHQRGAPERGEPLHLVEVSNGFGTLLPHRVALPDANGLPTPQIVEVRTLEDVALASALNPILPPTQWPTAAVLPNALPGNHFVAARFDQPLDIDTILTSDASAASSLTGAIRVERVDPASGVRRTLRGRAFVGGRTYGAKDPNDPTHLQLELWIEAAGAGRTIAVDPRGEGFPGTQSAFVGADLLADASAFVFVADTDGDLSTLESFPPGAQLQVVLTKEVRASEGPALELVGLASSSVGPDGVEPEVSATRKGRPLITPADGAVGVDPNTDVHIRFSEPLQPATLGDFDDGTPPGITGAITLSFGPAAGRVVVPYTIRPVSPYDLAGWILGLAYDLPGTGVVGSSCDLAAIELRVNADRVRDLAGNANERAHTLHFRTAEGRGLVNAPVTPDAIYVARGGASPALSVIDLNGYGASTGNPTYDLLHPILEGNSNYPNNPNVAAQGALLVPPLSVGTCSYDGGSAGVFTLTRSSALDDRLTTAAELGAAGEMALGHALDILFNGGTPFGCQAGGGNICATTGLKRIELIAGGPNTLAPRSVAPGVFPIKIVFGAENLVSFAPHPNPPPLVFPPLCQAPLLGQEPTSILTIRPPPAGPGLTNLLVPGPFPLGIPSIGLPPQGILSAEQNAWFEGPSPAQPNITQCVTFSVRQQVGHFLYALDRAAGEVVVLNSNRFTVLDRIAVPDPAALAMSPNLDLLAVASEGTDQVHFVDVDPLSATFHEVVRVTAVGDGPRGLAWESGNEDVFVCCGGDDSVHVISVFTLNVRKVLTTGIVEPLDVALTPRQTVFGFARGVYFGYVLNGDGTVAMYESGPDGINGFGLDGILETLPFVFASPRAIQADVTNLNSGFVVLHEEPLAPNGQPTGQSGGAVTRVGIVGGIPGPAPLTLPPQLRHLEVGVLESLGEGVNGLTGVPVDLAFDDQRNLSALTNFSTSFSPGSPLSVNGKSLVKPISGTVLAASAPQFLFLAVPDAPGRPGAIDVIDLSGFQRIDANVFHPGVQSIAAPGVTGLMHFFRQ